VSIHQWGYFLMAKYKKYNYDQMVMLPISLEDQLVPGTLEFAIHTLVEKRMDLSRFDDKYHNDETGRSAYDPKILLKVVLLGYLRGLNTSRKIEQACRENVTFMALSCGQRPDHSTIAAFVSSMKDEIVPLFGDVLLVCEEMNLLGGTLFALDGLRLPGNASERWTGTHAQLRKKKEAMGAKVRELLCEHTEQDKRDADPRKGGGPTGRVNRQKQIDRLQKQAARIEKFLKQNEPKVVGPKGKETTSNLTDNESARMWTSHGPIQGYNGQALIDAKHQLIVHAEAFGHSQDFAHGPPMLEGAKQNLNNLGHSEDYFEGKILTADSNYHSTVNILKCEEMKLDAYIPDRFFRKRDARFAKRRKPKKRFRLEDFRYDEAADHYVCPSGKRLQRRARLLRDGFIQRQYVADQKDCALCPLKLRCLIAKSHKRRHLSVHIGVDLTNPLRRMVAKVDSPEGRKIYPQRIGVAEPVFGNIRANKRLDRFTLRGKTKVNIQWLLYCMVHNIEKIANYGFA
jgi:transposase